ncbi:probable arginine--tRNA ligase, mitochondrial [Cephus cinctus]|uniref:Probable arginine--tRNA ligase, mitochondrial n=1 Tax=Cephus cinctus TaxID=211228 RepID=A0AAJ7FD08_CEPCN|nr:probable arginine--tRNA ligase, mitochondrial [Cephus cinctus]
MSSKIRSIIYNKVFHSSETLSAIDVCTALSHLTLKHNPPDRTYSFQLPLRTKQYNLEDEVRNFDKIPSDDFMQYVGPSETKVKKVASFHIPRNEFIKELLESNFHSVKPPSFSNNPQTVVIDFSSPNIAKPFHVGHLRSTIIGNVIANLNDFLNNRVRRINYLGDWGTQIGFVQLGLNMSNISEETIKNEPIQSLYKAYVHANKMAEKEPQIADQAREIFRQLELGNNTNIEQWETFKKYTVDELKKTYSRIGITFDEYHWESMYNADKLKTLISKMENLKLLVNDDQNRKVVRVNDEKDIPVIKSDGSTLYITRDIAAAIDRFERYNFDNMYYVVDNSQTNHFTNLIYILNKMQLPWANRLKHVKFGKLRGMSTRKGTAVFLKSILDESRIVMKEKQMQSPTTKVSLDENDSSAEILGISAIIINDLKQKRQRDYDFDWNTLSDMKGDTGVRLQYVHCRLVSLEENCGAKLVSECDPSVLQEPTVDDLITDIGRFDEIIFRAHQELEPHILVNYLLRLSHTINKALKVLQIKHMPSDIGSQRLLLFHSAKNVLAQGLRLLGITPMNKM